MSPTEPITEHALALAAAAGSGAKAPEQAVQELASAGDKASLEAAREQLVARIYSRSDDYEATGALNLVNQALAAVGWPDPYNWKHRRKP
ncbi:MAG TPA: hypothetical protein VK425_01315 [Acidimicrobiales bacterium]|nr:hypothetical protein [Acidimicrobiales bacterium]